MVSGRRIFAVAFVACWALGAAWAAASPPFSGPDETAHVLRAYAAGRGELIGDDAPPRPGIIGGVTRVEVPRSLGDRGEAFGCFVFQPQVPAGCATAVEPGSGTAEYETTAGKNPPLYHLLVAAPLEAWPHLVGLYLARLVGAGLAAALLAGAVAVCWQRGLRATLLGAFVACTPMVWFLAGVVNTSSLEIAGAVALWAGGVAVLHDWRRDERAGSGALVLMATGGAGLALARGLGPLWVAVVGTVLLALAWSGGALRHLLADRRAQVVAGIVGGAAALNGAWVLSTDSLGGSSMGLDVSLPGAVGHSVGRQMSMWRSAFANFGYLDTRPPDGVAVAWIAGAVALLLLAWTVMRLGERLVLAGLLAASVAVPVAVEASQYADLGPVWQGRYTLPLLVGAPVLAGWALDRGRRLVPTAASLFAAVVVVLTVAHGVAFWFAVRRYAVGSEGAIWFFRDDTWLTWKLVPVTLAGLLVIAALGWSTRWAVGALDPTDEDPDRR